MAILEKTKSYLDNVEQLAKKKFRFRTEMEYLIELASKSSRQILLDELTFKAKFVSNASNILKRFGVNRDDTVKLTVELQQGLEDSSSLIRNLSEYGGAEIQKQFANRFLDRSHSNVENLLEFLHELSWLKNYQLDNKNAKL